MSEKVSARGAVPESWNCIDCGINTAPGCSNRAQIDQAFAAPSVRAKQTVPHTFDERSEVYMVKPAVWKAAGMDEQGGCLCIGCLEKRLGRTLTPEDFPRHDPLNWLRGTERLLSRRDGA